MTDADLVLGYLDPDFFAGGAVRLDERASRRAIEAGVGKALGLDAVAAAWGVHEIANEDIARAFRIHASERGVDFRGCSMVAFGGAGPVHAVRVAAKLRIPTVIFPPGAGVFSAFGLLASPLCFDAMRTMRLGLEELTPERLDERFRPLIEDASELLLLAGVPRDGIRVLRRLDMRYKGQGFEVEVVLPDAADSRAVVDALPALFQRSYESVFAISLIDEPIEIVNWKVEAVGPQSVLEMRHGLTEALAKSDPVKGSRRAYLAEQHDFAPFTVYNRYALRPGAKITGPALVEERESTCLVGAGQRANIDEFYNLVVSLPIAESDNDQR